MIKLGDIDNREFSVGSTYMLKFINSALVFKENVILFENALSETGFLVDLEKSRAILTSRETSRFYQSQNCCKNANLVTVGSILFNP